MKYSLNPDAIISFIMNQYSILFGNQKREDISLLEDNYINNFSKNENSLKIIFDLVNLKFLYVSDNAEQIIGYSAAEIKKKGIRFFLTILTLEHIHFPYLWSNWVSEIYKKTGNLDDFKLIACGMKIKHKDGYIIRGLMRYSPTEILNNTKDGVCKTATMTFENITHLVKSDFYWMRAEYGLTEKYTHHILSTDKKDYPQDIITDREREVLCLIAEGKESKEIGAELFISPFTVLNHRRNMLIRTGTRDTTALVQIFRTAGII
jgi:DNA-binding CsgD family transcriptional regulator